MNVNMFAQQINDMHWRLSELYQGTSALVQQPPELLPAAFKELGIASEELQMAVEELHQQNIELVTTRAALEAERQRYQELFDFAPDAYLVTDLAGTIREVNRAAAKLLKVDQRFLVGKPLLIFVNENERQTFYIQLLRLQQAEQLQEWAVRLQPRHGELINASLTVATVSDQEGKVIGLRLCVREVTEHQRSDVAPERSSNNPTLDFPKHIYLKGEIITLTPQKIWQVCKGIVKLTTLCENGEHMLVGLIGPSMSFGSDLTSLHTYQATALSEVELVGFSATEIAASPHLAQIFLPQINKRLRQTEALLAIYGQRQVKRRLHHLLLLLKQEIGQPVEQGTRLSIRLTHQDLADACSTTRVTITRLLGKLQEQGIVTLDSKHHIILKDEG